jgi:hypothetical protein
LCGSNAKVGKQNVVAWLVERQMQGRVLWSDSKESLLDLKDCIACREHAPGVISTNALCGILSAASKLSGVKIISTQLKKMIGDLERLGLPVEYTSVYADVSENKARLCVFYWIKNLPLLFERMVTTCRNSGSFEESNTFSFLKNTTLFFRGIGRGGEDIIDLV